MCINIIHLLSLFFNFTFISSKDCVWTKIILKSWSIIVGMTMLAFFFRIDNLSKLGLNISIYSLRAWSSSYFF